MRRDIPAASRAGPRPAGEPAPDVERYRIAHRAMELEADEIAALANRLARSAPYSTRQARGLRRGIRILLDDLHRHHRAEDDVGWPILVAALPDTPPGAEPDPVQPDPAEPVRSLVTLAHEHEQLHLVMTAVREAAGKLVTQPDNQAVRRSLADATRQLADLLGRHIADEEALIFPLISAYVSVADFTRWEKAADQGIPLRDLPLLLPSTLRVVDPADRARITRQAPLTFRLALALCTGYFRHTHRLVFGAPDAPTVDHRAITPVPRQPADPVDRDGQPPVPGREAP
ncbi:MAG: hemerythrin domain-containing protein [Frankia sp.]